MATKTITLTGAEVAVTGLDGANAHIRNDSAAAIYAAKSADITVGADGVLSIPAGQSARLGSISGTVYLLGTGSVQLVSNDYTESPFKAVSTSGGADVIPNAAELVTLDGLQGGVPFSDITLSGDILGQDITLTACGKNLINNNYSKAILVTISDNGDSWFMEWSKGFFVRFNVDLVLPLNTDYTFSWEQKADNGTDAAMVAVLDADTLETISMQSGSEVITGTDYVRNSYSFNNGSHKKIIVEFVRATTSGSVNIKKAIQLERGGVSTSYEPYSGASYTITPDSNPYTVPNDIRQQDGINNVSVSAGEVSVTGVKRNAAVKRIWDKLDELTTAIIVSNGEIAE